MLHLKIMRGFKGFCFSSSEGNTAGRILGTHSDRSLTLGKQPAKELWSFASHQKKEIIKNVNQLCDL